MIIIQVIMFNPLKVMEKVELETKGPLHRQGGTPFDPLRTHSERLSAVNPARRELPYRLTGAGEK
jgi:hypothetical protein